MEEGEIVIGINETNIQNPNNKNNKSKNKAKKTLKKKNNISHNSSSSKKYNSKARISSSIKKSSQIDLVKSKRINAIALIFIFFISVFILLFSSLFDIKNIIVLDNKILSQDEIISLSGIEKYTNIYRFSKKNAVNNIKKNAYIENAKIRIKIPSTIEITVKERIPTFMLQYADSFVYINNQGYMLEISNDKLNIPVLVGCTTDLQNIKVGNRINDDDLKKLNTIIKIFEIAKSNDLGELITKIDLTDTRNYTIVLEGEGKTVYLGDCNDSDLNTKMLYLKSIVDASAGRSGEVFLNVNLNTQNVYVRWSTE